MLIPVIFWQHWNIKESGTIIVRLSWISNCDNTAPADNKTLKTSQMKCSLKQSLLQWTWCPSNGEVVVITRRHTRSNTRQNSGVLRVFSGNAGALTRISSVNGGKFLMKQYLQTIHTHAHTRQTVSARCQIYHQRQQDHSYTAFDSFS